MSTKKDKSQSERFKQAARELGVELDEEKLKKALRKVAKPEQKKRGDDQSEG